MSDQTMQRRQHADKLSRSGENSTAWIDSTRKLERGQPCPRELVLLPERADVAVRICLA